jgi:hypothetical protein
VERNIKIPSLTVRDANHDRVLSVLNTIRWEEDSTHCFCSACTNAIVAMALNCMSTHYCTDERLSGLIGTPWVIVNEAVNEAIEKKRMLQVTCVKGEQFHTMRR